ncbi:FtsX-like permease family protein [Aquimixticola soesokkakensis]|uniref:FtsX-like permease family protein n=1 Tax=Aquimixticola soesokkakensis TaxID=1519096 RepID=A0A1Y5T5G3_9RHOB|nr:FtsX-like permease family protein [Aquimixticola soesokkakensis]SLN56310.1 FtsX-like permease family protein [Aquimixticola soesokkakensis]
MFDLWARVPNLAQDALVACALFLPLGLIATALWRGFAPLPLVRAMLRRFWGTNLVFVVLIAVSVAMGIALIAQERALRAGMAQAADKFDLVIGAPGSQLSLLLASVFLQPSDVALVSGALYDEVAKAQNVDIAAPLAFGDSFEGAPVVGTIADFLTYLSDDRIEGRVFGAETEAVIGALVPLEIGAEFSPAHGSVALEEDSHAHAGVHFEVVGQMARTGTPWDHAILVPIEAVWEVHGLANGHAPAAAHDDHETHAHAQDEDHAARAPAAHPIGPPFDPAYFPGTPAIVVHTSELWANYALKSQFSRDGEAMGFFPGTVLAQLYGVMGDLRQAMSVMSLVSQGLVAAAVLSGLFILMRLFRRQVAMLRALGAPNRFVVAVIWTYATSLLLAGTVAGVILGAGAAQVLSLVVTARTDVVVTATLGWSEVHLALGFLCGVSLLALLPAWGVLRRPVAEGLRA